LKEIHHIFRAIIFSALIYGFASFGFPQQSAAEIGDSLAIRENELLYLDAESLKYIGEERLIVAKGNVYIAYNRSYLIADEVEFYQLTGRAIAKGNVCYKEKDENATVAEPKEMIDAIKDECSKDNKKDSEIITSDDDVAVKADQIELYFDTTQGIIFEGDLALEGDHYVEGTRIEKTANFKLTEQSLKNLRNQDIPDDVLENLNPLKKREPTSEDKFLVAVEKQIGEEHTAKYEELILKHAEKSEEDTYIVPKGEIGHYTACSGKSPAWSFSCTNAKIEKGQYIQGWHTVGYVKGIPIIYFPFIIFPIMTERQSGFLVPDFGRSSNNGFMLTNAYFWAISPSQDATFSHTYYDQRGHRFDLEYRYVYSKETDGIVEGTYFPDKESNEIKRSLNWYHRQTLPYEIKTIVNLDLKSDEQFDQEFGTDLSERTETELESNVSFTKNFSYTNEFSDTRKLSSEHTLRLLIDRLDNLREENTSQAKQRFPEIQFKSQLPGILGTPLNISQATIFAHLEEEGKQPKKFERLDTSATATLPITISALALTVSPTISGRAIYYSRDATTAVTTDGEHTLDAKPVQQQYYSASVGIDGPDFYRDFSVNKYGVREVKHLIEPTLSFRYNPAVKEANVPKFDGTDLRYRARSRSLYYGITQRLLAEKVAEESWAEFLEGDKELTDKDVKIEKKEIARLSLNQSYDFEADRRKFDDVTLKFTANPLDRYSLTVDAAYDVYIWTFYRTTVNFNAKLRNNWNIGVRWNRTATLDRDTDDILKIQRSLNLTTQLSLFDGLHLTYSGQFNVENGKHIKDSFGLTYTAQCWDVTATYTEQLVDDEVDNFFSFRLNLTNLGQLIDFEG
jgi:LPS-assembly protein